MMMAMCRGSCSGFNPTASIRASPSSVIAMSGLNRIPHVSSEVHGSMRTPAVDACDPVRSPSGHEDRLPALGADRDDRHGHAHLRAEELDIISVPAWAGRTTA